ncbi:MAG: trypsin-like peptidase domain-containing protein [Marinilabiliaceae bacterium]|nr:trypsin-like peptidase domain-containing protein [Marinilabiliaceae bacterium]
MKHIIVLGFLGFFCIAIKAQLSTEEIPYSWRSGNEILISEIPEVLLPNLDMETINKEDLANEGLSIPYRFGFSHDVVLSLSNSGFWQKTKDGGRLWNLRIYSPDALSLNLLYDKFWLPDSAKFFIYSEDMKQHIGAFTSENNKGDNEKNITGFATGFLFTNSIVLEYYEPSGTEENGIISICNVISGYRNIYDDEKEKNQNRDNHSDLLPCHNDVTCPIGNVCANEKRAVALFIMGGYYCTGALLNTTANDNRPIFLTADHCFSGNSTQWVFYWNYEAPCNSVSSPDYNKTTTGANILARRAQTDFMLLNLIEHPAMNPNVTVFYLGWDRTTTSATSGAGIHHPRGSQKKISLTNRTINNYTSTICWDRDPDTGICMGGTSPANTHWRVDFTCGTAEGGSSGSPLFNQNNRVIGQLHGGILVCPPNAIMYYGRFDLSWTGGGTSTTRLSDWLDPLGTNPTSINGKSCNLSIINRTYNTGTHILAGCGVAISNTTIEPNTNVRIHGQQSVILANFTAKSGSNVRITAGGVQGRGDDSTDNDDEVSILKSLELAVETETNDTSDVDFIVYPNPNDGNFTVHIRGEIEPYTLEIFNNSGGLLGFVDCNEEVVYINRTDLNSGIYYVKISMHEKVAVRRIIVQ